MRIKIIIIIIIKKCFNYYKHAFYLCLIIKTGDVEGNWAENILTYIKLH